MHFYILFHANVSSFYFLNADMHIKSVLRGKKKVRFTCQPSVARHAVEIENLAGTCRS